MTNTDETLRKMSLREVDRVTADGHELVMMGNNIAAEYALGKLSGWHTAALWLAGDDEIAGRASRGRIWLRALIAHLDGGSYPIDELDRDLAWRDAA